MQAHLVLTHGLKGVWFRVVKTSELKTAFKYAFRNSTRAATTRCLPKSNPRRWKNQNFARTRSCLSFPSAPSFRPRCFPSTECRFRTRVRKRITCITSWTSGWIATRASRSWDQTDAGSPRCSNSWRGKAARVGPFVHSLVRSFWSNRPFTIHPAVLSRRRLNAFCFTCAFSSRPMRDGVKHARVPRLSLKFGLDE